MTTDYASEAAADRGFRVEEPGLFWLDSRNGCRLPNTGGWFRRAASTTAGKEFSLTIPNSLLARANEVIE